MSSDDTLHYAQSEEESAKAVQHEIEKERADIAALQKDMNSKTDPADINALEKDINSRSDIASSLQQKYEQHVKDGQRLRQEYMQERQQEQEEQLRQQQEGKKSIMKEGAKDAISRGLFG